VSLVQRLLRRVPSSRAPQGKRYFSDGAAELYAVAAEGIDAHVRGSLDDPYDVRLRWPVERSNPVIRAACSCPNFLDGYTCKHIWAVLYAVDEEGGDPLPGRYDLRLMRDPKLLGAGRLGVNAATMPAARRPIAPRPNGKRPRASRREPAPGEVGGEIPPWLRSLQELRDRRDEAAREKPPARSTSDELWYVVDLPMTTSSGVLSLQLCVLHTRRDGSQEPRYVRANLALLRALDRSEDREIVALLQGSQPSEERLSYLMSPRDQVGYRIDSTLGDGFLQRIFATQRVAMKRETRSSAPDFERPLRWDGDHPWSFQLEIVEVLGGKMWRLAGLLVRGDEQVDLSAPIVLLADGYVLGRESLGRLDDSARAAFDWITLLKEGDPILAPTAERDRLVATLARIPGLPAVVWPERLGWQVRAVEPRPLVEITAPGAPSVLLVRGSVLFEYDGRRVDPRGGETAVVAPETHTWLPRDLERERALRAELSALDLPGVAFGIVDPWDLRIPRRDLPAVVRRLRTAGWHVEAQGQHLRHASSWSFAVTSGIDWFDVDARCEFDGASVPLPALLAAARRRDSFVTLGDGTLAMLPEEWLARFASLAELGEAHGDTMRFVNSQAALLDALLAEQEASVQVDARFEEWRERLRGFAGVRPRKAPARFVGVLREYQQIGLGWLGFLREFGLGGCLADDMGLGKTVQVLALLEHVREEMQAGATPRRPSLVVVPRSLVYNWIAEAARFTPELRVLDYTGLERHLRREDFAAVDLVVTTYGTLRRDALHLHDIEFEYAILDEAQAIKNAGSQSAKACRLLRARHRLAVTGTPVENHLGELWSIFEFLNPGMLGRAATFRGVSVEDSGGVESGWLVRALRPYILRRTKERVLKELPPKTEQTLHCEMDRKQRRLYDELREHYRQSLGRRIESQGLARSKIHVLEALLRLRQAACHPGLIDPTRASEPSAKLETLLAQVEEVLEGGHKALVFSQFTKLLAIVRQRLDERGVVYEYLDGRTRDRQARVNRFQEDPACGLFLISLKAGGQGLNLTAADYVFLLDPWWNPAVEAQAIDRTHRIGQTRRVFAYRLLCKDTVEEKIEALQARKRNLAATILTDDASFLKRLTAQDLALLLG